MLLKHQKVVEILAAVRIITMIDRPAGNVFKNLTIKLSTDFQEIFLTGPRLQLR